MIELFQTILLEAGVQLIVPAIITSVTCLLGYFKLVSVLKQRTRELQKKNQELIESSKKDNREWLLELWEKISQENLRDIKSLKEEGREKDNTISGLSAKNRDLQERIIKVRENYSKIEIQNTSLRFYIEIILSFIGDEDLLRKKIIEDPDFRSLMRDKDIDKILAEVQTIKDTSKPKKGFDWFKKTNLLCLFLALDLLHYGKTLLSQTRGDS